MHFTNIFTTILFIVRVLENSFLQLGKDCKEMVRTLSSRNFFLYLYLYYAIKHPLDNQPIKRNQLYRWGLLYEAPVLILLFLSNPSILVNINEDLETQIINFNCKFFHIFKKTNQEVGTV